MPKVSIVLPVYNGGRYLKESIDSIIAQTFTDWELIVVDDCSTDNSRDIAEEYIKADSRIHIIHNAVNQKLPKSLNIGFSAASGNYFTWTSDDNIYMPDALKIMAEFLDNVNDVYMVRADMLDIDENGKVLGESSTYSDEKLYIHNCVGACFMYKREVRDIIGNYDENFFGVEDYEYWLRIRQRLGRIFSIPQSLYLYRRHTGSLTLTREKEIHRQRIKLKSYYIDDFLKVLENNESQLYRIYCEIISSEHATDCIIDKFKKALPALCGIIPLSDEKKYIIFGAGRYGEKAAFYLDKKAVFFADSNPEKIKLKKCGLTVLCFQDAVRLAGQYCFIIAISEKRVYEMMLQLQKAGIKEYCVFKPEP